ncbi:hypothetical protein [Klebsiella phage phiKp_4]|jgi:hypothetical protein|uniref:Uncharacterized protein n=1 Tax=Escherichia phage phT4A TaxID=1852638 RepID=A0A193GZF8_9CAUD|nr:hypothetical protein KNT56_gp077 [Escherichia phage phT4A]UYL05697.1 hypothetical protein PMMJPKLI_00157 [Klebsiella phage KP13MC5-1]WKC55149.1 hypothetical protein R61_258 [Klebsiella phage R6_1]WKN59785.1 hypothetical protein ayl_00202 [Klebsiella phage AYL]WNA09011.1 hypothetical protein [Klebsiella phage P60_7]CAD5242337.1 hypothetical protein GCLPFEGH_00167 [Klebsiella phage vB_KpM-KalD]BEH83626.1 hypothetical protein [Klebsiella phage phiKp_1]BEH83747.1 hypothetical protein [Klebsie
MFVISSYYDSRQRVSLSSISKAPKDIDDFGLLNFVKKEIDRVVPEKYRIVKGSDSLTIVKMYGEVSIQHHVPLYPR